MTDLTQWLPRAVDAVERWQSEYGPFTGHPSLAVADDALARAFDDLTRRLRDNYPFFHPRYVGQMLKPPHPAAVLGYVTAMLINPNNHALDGGPATAAMEKDVVARLAGMFALPQHLGHLTSSGTIANLEALFVARESHPGMGVAYSADAHYTHARMCHVLGIEGIAIPTDGLGRMDLAALERALGAGRIGTVVATLGTTGLGALDPLPEIIALARAHGVRVHVDAAYGGFFALIADDAPDGVASAPFGAVADADSVVIDPHKHGLQPYGCGAVLFADPDVGRFYVHDSPYTYFSSDELHLGRDLPRVQSRGRGRGRPLAHPGGASAHVRRARLGPAPRPQERAAAGTASSSTPLPCARTSRPSSTSSRTSRGGHRCRRSTRPAHRCSTRPASAIRASRST